MACIHRTRKSGNDGLERSPHLEIAQSRWFREHGAGIVAAATPSHGLDGIQASRQIVANVLKRLETHGDANEPFTDTGAQSCFGADPPMGGSGRVSDGGFRIAQVRGD